MAIVLYLIVGLLYVGLEVMCDIGKELYKSRTPFIWDHFNNVGDYIPRVLIWPFRLMDDIRIARQDRAEAKKQREEYDKRWKELAEELKSTKR